MANVDVSPTEEQVAHGYYADCTRRYPHPYKRPSWVERLSTAKVVFVPWQSGTWAVAVLRPEFDWMDALPTAYALVEAVETDGGWRWEVRA